MKIGSFDTQAAALLNIERRDGQAAKGGAKAAAPAGAGVTVSLSPLASALHPAADGGDFDAAKVERIAREIREGRYQVNPEAIADQLIANAQELLSRSNRK